MERTILGTMLKSRSGYELIQSYLDFKNYSRPFQIVLDYINKFYARDAEATSIDQALFEEQLKTTVNNPKHLDEFLSMTAAAYSVEVSEPNVKAMVLEAKRKEMGEQVATSIVNGKDTTKQLEEYLAILNTLHLEDLDSATGEAEVFENVDLRTLLEEELDTRSGLMLYPKSLGDKVGPLRDGDHILVYAPPETGKTATCLSFSGGFCRQGGRGLYFGNEDRVKRLMLRQVSNLTGMTSSEIARDIDKAMTLANEAGYQNVVFIELSPGTPEQIDHYVEKYKPAWIIIDQLPNLRMKAETRVNQLESLGGAARNIGKKRRCVVISVSQAGDSGRDKEVLDMGDVYMSNTGLPAAMDVMIGIGKSKNLEEQGLICYSLPKNKLSGDHGSVIVRINPFISRVSSL